MLCTEYLPEKFGPVLLQKPKNEAFKAVATSLTNSPRRESRTRVKVTPFAARPKALHFSIANSANLSAVA
jgi:hypothetical protein